MNLSNQSTDALRAELTRIEASQKPAGPLFGTGYYNFRSLARDLRAEIERRGELAGPIAPRSTEPRPTEPTWADVMRGHGSAPQPPGESPVPSGELDDEARHMASHPDHRPESSSGAAWDGLIHHGND